MVKKVLLSLSATVCLTALGCESRQAGDISEYFWPLRQGDKYVYNVTDPVISGTHSVDILSVRKDKGTTRVLARETYDLSIAGRADKQSYNVEYRIMGGNGSIIKFDPDSGRENVLIEGPVRTGTKWPITVQSVARMHDEFGVKVDTPKQMSGEGRVDGVKKMKTVGGVERECATVGYYAEAGPLPKLVLCKGLGIAGVLYPEADAGGAPQWIEKLEGFEGSVSRAAK